MDPLRETRANCQDQKTPGNGPQTAVEIRRNREKSPRNPISDLSRQEIRGQKFHAQIQAKTAEKVQFAARNGDQIPEFLQKQEDLYFFEADSRIFERFGEFDCVYAIVQRGE